MTTDEPRTGRLCECPDCRCVHVGPSFGGICEACRRGAHTPTPEWIRRQRAKSLPTKVYGHA